MAYEPTDWKCGDVVEAELLNKIEEELERLSLIADNLEARVTALEGGGESEEEPTT